MLLQVAAQWHDTARDKLYKSRVARQIWKLPFHHAKHVMVVKRLKLSITQLLIKVVNMAV